MSKLTIDQLAAQVAELTEKIESQNAEITELKARKSEL